MLNQPNPADAHPHSDIGDGGDADLIAGFCRFSFLGQGDWQALRQQAGATTDWAARAALLYDEKRLAARFAAFETVCLPSILAQDDPRFVFVVITSPELPDPWMRRLRELCAQSRSIRLEVMANRSLSDGIAPLLQSLHDSAPRNLVQFRLDDDDALAVGFAARLRSMAARVADLPEFAVSMPHGLAVALYPGHPVKGLAYNIPFLGAGLAVKTANPTRTIFAMGHFGVARRMTHIVDRGRPGALLVKWPSDSRELSLDRLPSEYKVLPPWRLRAMLAEHFPWLTLASFEPLRASVEADAPALVATRQRIELSAAPAEPGDGPVAPAE